MVSVKKGAKITLASKVFLFLRFIAVLFIVCFSNYHDKASHIVVLNRKRKSGSMAWIETIVEFIYRQDLILIMSFLSQTAPEKKPVHGGTCRKKEESF